MKIDNDFVLYLFCFCMVLFVGRIIFYIFKHFLGIKWGVFFVVNIYTETPIIDIKSIITQYFGLASNPIVYDLAILFSAMIFLIFCYCILLLLFRK